MALSQLTIILNIQTYLEKIQVCAAPETSLYTCKEDVRVMYGLNLALDSTIKGESGRKCHPCKLQEIVTVAVCSATSSTLSEVKGKMMKCLTVWSESN